MKKMIAVLLLVALVFSVMGCGKEEETAQNVVSEYEAKGFSMGYSIIDITPEESTPLAGFGATQHRLSNNVLYPLKATAIAMTGSDGTTVLLMELDLITARASWAENAVQRISAATGLPTSQIMLACSHTHAGPDLAQTSFPSIVTYTTMLYDRLSQVSVEALNDRKPAEVYYSEVETEGLNWVRHYYNTASDGTVTYFGDNFGHDVEVDSTTQHTSDADPTMHVVKFVREGEKDTVLCNFRAHPSLHGSSSKYDVSADYIGAFREAMYLMADCEFMYIQGGCGNINQTSKISGETKTMDAEEYGTLLAEYAVEALENMTKAEGQIVKTETVTIQGEINHTTDSLLLQAKEISTEWNLNRDIQTCLEMGKPYGIRSPFHANAIISRAGKGESEEIQLSTVAIGDDLAFIVSPFEMFDQLTVYIEENAAYDKVITVGYAYPHKSYLPSEYGWSYTSYETDTFPFVPGTGELVRDTLMELLDKMKNG